jgi:hypothetical protein
MHVESERKSAEELGIPMPYPTIKPLWVALGMVVMVSGLLFLVSSKTLAFSLIAVGAATMIYSLYNWLTTPLE